MSKKTVFKFVYVVILVWVLSLTPEFGFNLSDEKTLITYIFVTLFAAALGTIIVGIPVVFLGQVIGLVEE